jgi:anti-sigma regulatory factor (Ser/Thr protein kinase)
LSNKLLGSFIKRGQEALSLLIQTQISIEIVAKPESIQIYITDHGKAVKLDGAIAKVTLLNGTADSRVKCNTR